MTAPPLIVRDNPGRHRFEIDLGDGSIAIAEYTLPAGKIMFTHTEVPEAHEGKGIGTMLIEFGLAAARKRWATAGAVRKWSRRLSPISDHSAARP